MKKGTINSFFFKEGGGVVGTLDFGKTNLFKKR